MIIGISKFKGQKRYIGIIKCSKPERMICALLNIIYESVIGAWFLTLWNFEHFNPVKEPRNDDAQGMYQHALF